MKTSQLVTTTIETAITENTTKMALIASLKDESFEIVFETMQAPSIAAGILLASQDAAKNIDRRIIAIELSYNLENTMRTLPEAIDISLIADGDVLCINVGSGALFFRLSEPAKRAVGELIDKP